MLIVDGGLVLITLALDTTDQQLTCLAVWTYHIGGA